MSQVKKIRSNVKVPVWAINYLEYGENEGLQGDEKQIVDEWYENLMKNAEKKFKTNVKSLTFEWKEDESDFEFFPEFGLACNCAETDIYVSL